MKRIICISTILLCFIMNMNAQLDPVRVAAVKDAESKSKKTIQAQDGLQGLMTTGHMWIKEEVELTTNFQRQFNEYLDSIHNIMEVAAEVFGIYFEINRVMKNVSALKNTVTEEEKTGNVVALAISKRGRIYKDLVETGIDVIGDIKKACFTKAKLTEKERLVILSSVRPKLVKFNNQLCRLNFCLRYTSFLTVWNEIRGKRKQYHLVDSTRKKQIIDNAITGWHERMADIRPTVKKTGS